MGVYNSYPAAAALTGPEQFGPVRQGANDTTVTLAQIAAGVQAAAVSGTWTPQLQFGGAAVGMAGTFMGEYLQLGPLVMFTMTIVLSAVGSSTGSAVIANLPVNNNSGVPSAIIGSLTPSYTSGLVGVTGNLVSGRVQPNKVILNAGVVDASSPTLSNANFGVGSILIASGMYFAA